MEPNNLPESFFQSLQLSDAIVNDIKESFKTGKGIIEALRHAQSTTPATDVSSHERLRWISDSVTIVGNDLNACLFLLNDDSLKSLYDAAVKFYHSDTIIGKSKPIRAALLYRVPTAVLSGIVNQNLLGLKPEVQQLLSKVLELATAEEFDLRSETLGKLISQPKYQSILAQDDTGEVQRTLESLYRLHCIVKDAEDLKYLVGTRFTSAHRIASTDYDTFTAAMEEKKMSPLVSGRIHTEATRIDRRNEAYWLDIVRSRQNVPILAIAGRQTQDNSDADTVPANLTTLFQDLDSVKTDDSTSVLSPACYLVDLLGILKGVTLTNSLFKIDNANTALDVLLHRRPDIATRELSKENTETPIAYMDLAIEVMESYVAKQLKLQGDPRMGIYANGLNRQLVPMAIFPYNNAIATSRNYLKERGYSRYELLQLFRSDHDLASRAFPLRPSRGVRIARETNNRRLAAEYLGLQPADFKAITQEAFHTQKFIDQLQDQKPELATCNYSDIIGLPSAGDYWGYEADADNKTKTANWQMIDQASENSLRLVEKELLPRSGLTFSELNAVLKTRYIGRRLVMTMERDGKFSDHLQDMRLQESSLVTGTEVTGKLSHRTLQDLQAFLRLRYRLCWSIEVMDAAIATLARRSPVYSDSDRTFHVLDGGFVELLAAAHQFSALTGLSLPAVLPFWGPMDAEFRTSLYTKLFLGSNSLKQYPYLRIKDGKTVKDATFGHNLDAMLLSLRMTPADWLVFADLLELDQSTPWTLDRVAQIYSHHTLCRLLGLPAKRYKYWWSLCQQRADPFLDPQSAIMALTPWIDLPEGVKSAEAALGLVMPPDATSETTSFELVFIAQTLQGLENVELKYEKTLNTELDIEAAQVYTADALAGLCSLVLGRAASMDVVQLVDGSSGVNTGITLPKETEIPSTLKGKTVKQPSGPIRLYGILLQNEKEELKKLLPENKEWEHAIDQYYQAQMATVRIVCQYFKLDEKEIITVYQNPPAGGDSEASEKEAISRRKTIMRWMVPEMKRREMKEVIQTTLATRFPVAAQLLEALVNMPIPGVTDTSQTYLEYLKEIGNRSKTWFNQPEHDLSPTAIFFFPPITAEYTFITRATNGWLMLDDQKIDFSSGRSSRSFTLRQGQAYRLSLDSSQSFEELTYSTPDNGEQRFVATLRCPAPLAKDVSIALRHLDKGLQVAQAFSLNADEVRYQHEQGVTILTPDIATLTRLEQFVQVRKEFNVSGSALITYTRRLARLSEAEPTTDKQRNNDQQQLVAALYDLTKLDIKDISAILDNEWPNIFATERAKHLLDMPELHRLHERCEMARNLSVPLADLFKWAGLSVLPSEDEDFLFVEQLETALSSGTARNAIFRAKEGLRSQQRQVLQEYLLRMPDIRSRKITTADGLSAELLIDVQMGPVLEISRIAQAIHTVQLFIQRSLLGLEKAYGIPTTAIPQARWSWSCKYSLWQANRKVFLYPENWVDPSLRDEKSQAFAELESKVLQTSLTKESIDQILREYVYTVHDLSDLEVESYVWESIQGVHGNYHFFARTRTAPFVFYYRRLSIEGAPHDTPTWSWHPWTKMEVDISTHEQDFDHKALSRPGTYLLPALYSGRLMLFIPQITRKTLPAEPSKTSGKKLADSTTDDLKSPPLEYWEVRMAWTELRDGKWSPKYVTPTGIEVKPVDNVLPSISSFRFRLPEVPTSSQPSPRPTLVINVDRQQKVKDKDTWTYWNLGTFEMQGPRLRLTQSCPGGREIASEVNADIIFSRFVHNSQAKTFDDLVKEVQNYQVGLTSQAQRLLLALPNPKQLAGANETIPAYQLDWLLAFDDSQFPGASGLVVERSTSSHVQSFFGYPHVGNDGKIDRSNRAIPGTDLLTDEASQLLMGEIADNEGFRCIYNLLETLPPTTYGKVKMENSEAYHELKSPTSSYSWELGFHAVALILERLLATQQFQLALEISRLVFDPSRNDVDPTSAGLSSESQKKPLSRLDKCWRFVPFRSSKLRLAGSVRDIIQSLTSDLGKSDEIAYWEANPFSPHAVARRRPAVYMKRFVMKCIETLVASGDQYFRQDSLEAVPLAIQQYTEASELFGPGPVAIDQPTKSVTRTYAQIKDAVNDFSSASVDMELDFPYCINPVDRGTDKTKNGTLGFVKSTYFGVPENPQMQELRDRLDDRLYKIRNGLDINGNPRRLPLFDPPLDVGNLVAAVSGGGSLSSVIENIQGPMPYYRSTYLIQKALELCNELRYFSESFLAVKEKRDAEAMSSLRVRQERVIQSLMVGIKQTQIAEATSAIDSLVETRKANVMRLKYYLALIGESTDEVPTPNTEWSDIPQVIGPIKDKELRMSAEEAEEKELTEAAAHTNRIATALESTTAVLMSLPKLTVQAEPMGVGTSMQMDSSIVGQGILVAAGVIRANAMAQTDGAFRASRKAGAIRQLQDRKLQANMAGHDIKNIDKQIANQRKRIEIAQGELRLQQQQVADTTETEAFLRTKYTSEKLYAWLDMATRKLAYESYIVALDMAKTAERALAFEYGPRAQTILSTGYWDETRDGLLSAQNLGAALRRMEKFHLQNSTHDYELTKTISLRQVSPLALIDLRTKGVAEFALPEVLFDQDFPGHYCRRIKSVSVTIPSIVGPYTGINCTLRLLEHRYRLKAGASGGNYYARDVSNDERFHTDPIPLSSVALSTCNQDTGTFELQFNGDQYVPFEGAGVISRWKLELPGPFHEFDYRSISDLVLTMRYTAIDGGAIWKKTASDAVVGFRKELNNDLEICGAFLQLDLPVEMSGEWRQLCRDIEQKKSETEAVEMDLSRVPQTLPFWARGSNITVQKLWMVLQVGHDGWDDSAASGSIHLLGQELKKPKKEPGSDYVVLADNKDGALQQELKDNLKLSISPKTLKGKGPQSCWVVFQYTIS